MEEGKETFPRAETPENFVDVPVVILATADRAAENPILDAIVARAGTVPAVAEDPAVTDIVGLGLMARAAGTAAVAHFLVNSAREERRESRILLRMVCKRPVISVDL